MKWLWPFAALLVGCTSGPKEFTHRLAVVDLAHALSGHIATHFDVTAHLASTDELPAERLVGPGVVIHISDKCATEVDYRLSYLDIKRWESRHGRIPNGAILLIRTGWDRHWNDPKAYLNADEGGTLHFPGISVEAAEYLVKYRDVSAVGIDTLSVDYGPSSEFEVHQILHAAGIHHIENVTDMSRVPPTGSMIVAAPPEIAGASGSPYRVSATIPEPVTPSRGPAGRKYLIEFGWDIPSERTLADAAAAGTAFDGAVFDAELIDAAGKRERFSWLSFGEYRMTPAQVDRIVEDLRRTPARFRRRSFIRFNVTPGLIDWFDDWSGILANARGAARIVRRTGLAGILFDVEQYQSAIFDYRTRPGSRSFAEVAERVRRRGEDFMRAINAEHPAIEMLLTFGYSLAGRKSDRDHAAYGLLPSFLDGMFAERGPAARIIDGYEFAYPFKTASAFERGRAEILRDSDGRCEVGFGIWLDWNSGKLGWHNDPSDNWFSAEEFEHALRQALHQTDRYVWVYSERLNWWTGEHLPDAYVRALSAARRPAAERCGGPPPR